MSGLVPCTNQVLIHWCDPSGMCVSKKNGHLGHCTSYIYVSHSQELRIVLVLLTSVGTHFVPVLE